MSDPNIRHVVCPECHTHQTVYGTGRLAYHAAEDGDCPGGGDYPNRAHKEAGQRDATNMFASCPAATGEPYGGKEGCPHFPDGAHRCGSERTHITPANPEHVCTCGYHWFTYGGSITGLIELLNGPPR